MEKALAWATGQSDDALRQKLEFVLEENRVYRSCSIAIRLLLRDAERKVLAKKGKPPGKLSGEVITIVQPETLLKWHRRLVASKWDFSRRRRAKPGRPFIPAELEQLVLKFARENPGRGYDRIVGAMANLGCHISDQTVGNFLKRHGMAKTKWKDGQCCWTGQRAERTHSRLRQARPEAARSGRERNHRGVCVGLAHSNDVGIVLRHKLP